ncbi:LOW QUALITY PROTEIN: killer cell lectin-like receptor 2 [Dugong dugon]
MEFILLQGFSTKHLSFLTLDMSNEVIYSTLGFLQSPLESQHRLRPGGTKRPRETDDKEFSAPWRLIAITLGVFCLLLLMTVAVLGTKIFQYIQEKHHQEDMLRNLSQNHHIMQNDSYLKEQKKELDSSFIKKSRCHRKNEISSESLQNMGKLYEEKWTCCGVTRYYFTTEHKTWKDCQQICQNYRSSLLKIDDKDELVFIQSQAYHNTYWIGLSYDNMENKWKWVHSSTSPGFNFTIMSLPSARGNCAFLTSTRITNIECSNTYSCICEKRVDCFLLTIAISNLAEDNHTKQANYVPRAVLGANDTKKKRQRVRYHDSLESLRLLDPRGVCAYQVCSAGLQWELMRKIEESPLSGPEAQNLTTLRSFSHTKQKL